VRKPPHVYAFPDKLHAFQFQPLSLLVPSNSPQLYLSADTYDSMPRQLIYGVDA
jgi:hypothetical protein